jgi:micrococcal nuclease
LRPAAPTLAVAGVIAAALWSNTFDRQNTVSDQPPTEGSAPSETVAGAQVYVIDGDTVRLPGGERVRLLGIDAPEMPPRAACEREAALAYQAKARLQGLIRGGDVTLWAGVEDRDRFGRLLRRVEIHGADLGDRLVSEGLAQPWRGRKAVWC